MAITYHAGRRIQGLSTDVANTPTLEDDFTSDNFDTQGTKNQVNTGTGVIDFDFNRDGSNHKTKIDTTLGNEFVVRWTQTWDNIAFISGNPIGFIGLGNTAETVNIQSTTNDFLGFEIVVMNSGVVELRAVSAIGENINLSTQDDILTKSPAENETLGYEIIRYSDTDWEINIYDSTFTTLEDTTGLLTTASSSLDTTNFMVATFPTGSQSSQGDGTIDNLEIYNGVSSLTNKPSNVQLGSRFEETDTRKMYNLQGASTTTYETDFSTDPTISSNDIGNNYYDSTNDRWYIRWDWDNTNDAGSIDLYSKIGNQNLSDSDWVVRFKYTIVSQNFTIGTDSKQFFVGLTSTDYSNAFWYPDNSNVSTNFGLYMNKSGTYQLYTNNNSTYSGGTWTNTSRSISNETLYVELIRENSTTAKMNLYSDSSYSTLLVGVSLTIASGLTGLRYLSVKGMRYSSSGTITSNMDDLEIYNDISSVLASNTWQEIGA
jgi:hypothetical protein